MNIQKKKTSTFRGKRIIAGYQKLLKHTHTHILNIIQSKTFNVSYTSDKKNEKRSIKLQL